MIKFVSSFVICTALATHTYAATEKADYGTGTTSEETTGVIGGVVLGALAGGPPGAIVGGALGALFGDGWNAKREIGGLQLDLAKNRFELAQAKQESERINALYIAAKKQLSNGQNSNFGAMNVAYNSSSLPVCCANTALSVHFRTGSNHIETQYQDQLAGIGKMVKAMPGTRLEIVGYADRNGDAKTNLKLSKQRTDAVRVFFNTLGISNNSITTIAYGESKPVDITQSIESDFFDRKVIVRLKDSNDQLVTADSDNR